ncbi:MAG: element excision factor XisI family protein [Bacteroidota bacterium]
MDRALKNKEALLQILDELSKGSNSDLLDARTQLLADEEKEIYALFFIGWAEDRYIHNLMFHFAMKEGQVWIYENNTDYLVHEGLMNLGVKKEDIIFAWEAFPNVESLEAAVA